MLTARATVALALFALGAIVVFGPAAAVASPRDDGVVLWLDADQPKTITKDAAGRISRWADKSGSGNHAVQAELTLQPRYVPDALGGKPVVRFDGAAYLNLGQASSLDFPPGHSFTIVVVSRVRAKDSGTFISKGGGSAGERSYQFYVAPGRQGAITYGAMRETPRTAETSIAFLVCKGSRTDVYVNGTSCLSFKAGKGKSEVDVLVGARRKDADNTGTFYLLKGDLAELLVCDRALTDEEIGRMGDYLNKKYSMEAEYVDPHDADKLVAMLATPEAAARLDMLATSLARLGKRAVAPLRSLLDREPTAASMVAELLLRMAENNQLSNELAMLGAGLLEHDDPFVRGMAEWAIAMKVGGQNNGQEAVWPSAEPPEWYRAWSGLSAQQLLEADWVRQAASTRIHRDAAKLAASVDSMIDRAERMVSDFEGSWAPGGHPGGRGRAERAPGNQHCGLATLDHSHPGAVSHPDAVIADELAALGSIRSQMGEQAAASPDDLAASRRLWLEGRRHLRAIVMANPAIDFEGIVFVKQFAPHTVRNITRSYAWKHKPGGDICILTDLRSGRDVREIIKGRLGPGYVWGLDLWWDADRVVFGYARQPNWPPAVNTADYRIEGTNVFNLRKVHEPIHLFEVGIDGSPLRQLTDDPYWSDFEPTYCATGEVVFASDRCARSAECGNDTYDHTNPNLYSLSPDGTVRHLTDSKDIDRYPHSLADGRIAYTHWEYQERHFMEVHALWTLRPDGTMSDALFKHHMRAPCGLRDTRSIPGTTKLVSIAAGHHTFAYGPVVVVNPAVGMNNEAGLAIVTPGVRPQEGPMAGKPVAEGGVPDAGGLYQTPWALSEKCFLVSYSYARPNCTAPAGADSNGFALYLIDSYGNRELVHRDPLLSCTFPIPLKKRPRPPIVPDTRGGLSQFSRSENGTVPFQPAARRVGACTHAANSPADTAPTKTRACQHAPYATCYVTDVYDGLEEVPRGTIRFIRVSQHVAWPFDIERGQMDYIPGNAGTRRIDFQSWSPVRVIGTVPVESDGSASFTVPADTALYFQALDERQMEIRRMRSMVSFKAGEVRGCNGCHETRAAAPASSGRIPLALKRAPRTPTPPPWGSEKMLGYEWLVQPILDRHCTSCHGKEDPDGGLDFTATRASDGLCQSFRTMFGVLPGRKEKGRVLVSCSNRFSNADVSKPKEFGSHASPLVRVLVDDELHRSEAELSPTDWLSLVTWVDANAPYYDAFINKRPSAGGGPVREVLPEFPPFALETPQAAPLLGPRH